MLNQTLKTIVHSHPEIVPLLKGRALWYAIAFTGAKSYDYYLSNIEGLVQGVYDGNVGGDFINILKDLILGQISDAYETAWADEGTDEDVPDYLQSAAHDTIQNQYDYVEQFYKDVVDARVDKTDIAPLLNRAQLWANRWTESYNNAVSLIAAENGEKQIWNLGETEQHCPFCKAFHGIVAYAREWQELGIAPQNAPNPILSGTREGEKGCAGWHCDCSLTVTDQRRSPKAFQTLMDIVNKE